MPTITANSRPVIGGHSEESFRQPRASVKASTGMELPPLTPKSTDPVDTQPKTGQSAIKEETSTSAVTLSPQLTALARKQQSLQREIQAQRDKEAAWASKEADYVPKSAFKEKLQQDAAGALKDLGLDYEELTNLLLSQQQSSDPVKKLEAQLNELKSSQEQNVTKQYEATVAQYRAEIDSVVASNDEFITVREEKAEGAVLQHILDTFKEEGKVLTVEASLKDIEDFLVEEAFKKASLTKVKAKLSPPVEKAAEQKLPPPRSGARTLTNQVDTTPTRGHNQFQHLSMRERIEQSIARAQK